MFQEFESPPSATTAWTRARISQLRDELRHRKLAAYIVPRADAHQGEYVAACDERLAWLTGFTGSAGNAIVADNRAALFVDGRYKLQAPAQTDGTSIEIAEAGTAAMVAWLIGACQAGDAVGVDPRLIPLALAETLNAQLKPAGIKLKAIDANLIDRLWGAERPTQPTAPVCVHDEALAGRSAADKISALQETLRNDGDSACVLTLPDSICWLLNIRGGDVAHTPIVRAFAVVPARGKPILFIKAAKLGTEARAHLKDLAKTAAPNELRAQLHQLRSADGPIRLDPNTAGWWVAKQIGTAHLHRAPDPCVRPKATKTDAEIAGARAAHVRDGTAMARFLAWLDENAPAGKVDEISATQQLEAFRRETGELLEISFDTISGAGPNGAIVHYRVTEATNRRLNKGELFLIDSGGQYRDGTTDITRTIAVGRPTKEMVRNFTAVLKGHIAIATARFPKGTRGIDLDPLARTPLWQAGLDYDHGTGHGVGSYLSVHEGPQSISKRGMTVIEPGMIISNEPGFYREGAYGIRLENLVLVEALSPIAGGERDMMSFETLTLAPFDRRLIAADQLAEGERAWLNAYHKRVAKEIGPLLDKPTRDWLKAACAPL